MVNEEEHEKKVEYNEDDLVKRISSAESWEEKEKLREFIIRHGKEFVSNRKKDILEKYNGMHIAVINDTIVDSDSNYSSLANRVFKKYGDRTIYIPYISEKEIVSKAPSPHVVR